MVLIPVVLVTPKGFLDEESRVIFKAPSTKVLSGRNKFAPCGYAQCSNRESPDEPKKKFSVCASCKHTRYCSREHQIEDWKSHKADCKSRQEMNKACGIRLDAGQEPSETQKIDSLLEDFVQLHGSTLHQIINHAYHTQIQINPCPGMDVSNMWAELSLEYRPDCGGNPATAFQFNLIKIGELKPDTLSEKERRNKEAITINRRNDPSFMHCIYCSYRIGEKSIYHNFSAICRMDLPLKMTTEWLYSMRFMLYSGVVLRAVGAGGTWRPGIMIKSQKKWVWKQVDLRDVLRGTTTLINPPMEHWGQCRLTGSNVIYDRITGEPWVAPSYFWRN